MELIVICLLMEQKFKANDSKIVANPLCLGNISEEYPVANMKKHWIIYIIDLFLILVLIIEPLQFIIY